MRAPALSSLTRWLRSRTAADKELLAASSTLMTRAPQKLFVFFLSHALAALFDK
ncbi:hypothetical protein IMCC26207_108201 [Actinobacteria bacterium IMCC26207]|uniref:Unannotated protein n=1 Tax=freshwater metagenome TaxID=449393 RepID=A0A6J6Q9R9_9ZZZZ|nr:hypothetical protein IMCC26207_108201 [Actinobacteria bacterium IMCC26207]